MTSSMAWLMPSRERRPLRLLLPLPLLPLACMPTHAAPAWPRVVPIDPFLSFWSRGCGGLTHPYLSVCVCALGSSHLIPLLILTLPSPFLPSFLLFCMMQPPDPTT